MRTGARSQFRFAALLGENAENSLHQEKKFITLDLKAEDGAIAGVVSEARSAATAALSRPR